MQKLNMLLMFGLLFLSGIALAQVKPSDTYCEKYPDDKGCTGQLEQKSSLISKSIDETVSNSLPKEYTTLKYDISFDSLKGTSKNS